MRRIRTMTIKPRVMIDCLVAEGVVWAGWYKPANLDRKFDEVTSGFLAGGHGLSFSAIHARDYRLQMGDRRARR